MGLLTFSLNVTLDGFNDHRAAIADDELLDHFTQLMDAAGAMLFGRTPGAAAAPRPRLDEAPEVRRAGAALPPERRMTLAALGLLSGCSPC
jgi:hypothetical protein